MPMSLNARTSFLNCSSDCPGKLNTKSTLTVSNFPCTINNLFLVSSAAGITADRDSYYSLTRDGVKIVDSVKGVDLTRAATSLHEPDYTFDPARVIVIWSQGEGYNLDDVPRFRDLVLENETGAYHADTRFLVMAMLPTTQATRNEFAEMASKLGRAVVVAGLGGNTSLLSQVSAVKANYVPLRAVPNAKVFAIITAQAAASGKTVTQVLTEKRK